MINRSQETGCGNAPGVYQFHEPYILRAYSLQRKLNMARIAISLELLLGHHCDAPQPLSVKRARQAGDTFSFTLTTTRRCNTDGI